MIAVVSEQPGLMIFDSTGELISVNEQTATWLRELPADHCLPTDLGVAVPMWLMVTVFQAAAGVAGNRHGTARARIRSRRGQWLVCHATCLRDVDGSVDQVAVVIEPAPASEVAPIIIDAYGLTEREQQITTLIARCDHHRHRRRAVPLGPHRPRPRQDHLPQGRGHQPR